ncbi:MAG: restriction endonuclease subunit S [Cyanobium sp. M30B3]|nr:MAG: restriction endonuclease subunit S [Cyanobium sp. M30B3]
MKTGWDTMPLGDVCPISNRKPEVFTGLRRYFSTGAVGSEGELSEPDLVDYANRPSRAGCMPEVGDIGFARMKGTKKVILIDSSLKGSLFSTGFCFVTPRSNVESRYAFYFLTSDNFQSQKDDVAGDGIMGGVRNSHAAAIGMPLPTLAEQQRIVGLLDDVFQGLAVAKASAEKNLENARSLFKSQLQVVFSRRGRGWVDRRLDAIAEFSQGIQVGLGDQSSTPITGMVRFIRIIDYTQGTDDIRYVPDPGPRYWADRSDIVMVRYGSPGLVGRGIEGVIANNLFKISIRDDSLTNDFLAYFLGQETVQKFLSSQGSSTMPALTFKQLGAVVVSFPHEIEQQNEIVTKLDSFRQETQRLTHLYERKLAALEDLKKTLLHQAFNGEL